MNPALERIAAVLAKPGAELDAAGVIGWYVVSMAGLDTDRPVVHFAWPDAKAWYEGAHARPWMVSLSTGAGSSTTLAEALERANTTEAE